MPTIYLYQFLFICEKCIVNTFKMQEYLLGINFKLKKKKERIQLSKINWDKLSKRRIKELLML